MKDKDKKIIDTADRLTIYSPLFFKIMFNNAKATSILILDTEGIIIDVNEAFVETFGYTKEELIDSDFSFLFIEQDREKGIPQIELAKTIKTGSSIDNNFILHKDGSQLWVHGESIFTQDDKNKNFLIKIIQDITEQKVLERELQLRNEDLKKTVNDRNNFIYTVSHDLLSPINNIEGLIRYLESEVKDSSEAKFFIEKIYMLIESYRKRMRELTIIGGEQEREKIQVNDINVNDFFEEIREEIFIDFKEDIEKSKAEFITDFKDAPFIRFSKKNLRSILTNLLSNAIKYRSPQRDLIIHISTKIINGAYFLLSVQDNGLGIRMEDQDNVFQMYKRGYSHVEGTGIGLSIVKRIVDNEGGKIEIESKLGEGTTFNIFLPI